MPAYRYRAATSQGHVHTGVINAANENDLAIMLSTRGLELITGTAQSHTPRSFSRHETKKNRREKVALFCRQMQDLLGAGIAFQDAFLPILSAVPPGPFQNKLTEIARAIEHGQDLSTAFANGAPYVDPVFLSLLKAGEAGGDLAGTFGLLAAYVEKERAQAEARARALRYPLFLLILALGVTTFMIELVIPEIVSFLQTLGGSMPPATRFLIRASNLFSALWLPCLGGTGFLLGLSFFLRAKVPSCAIGIDQLQLKLPFYGSLARQNAMARWLKTLALLLQNGLTVPEALQTAQDVLINQALAVQVRQAAERIQTGASLSDAFAPFLKPLELYALQMAETSGTLPRTLDRLAQSAQESLDLQSARFLGLLEPGLTLGVGLLLLWVVLAVLGPVYGNLGVLGGGPV